MSATKSTAESSSPNPFRDEEFEIITMDVEKVANDPALSIKMTPLHDTIGIDASLKSTDFCATVTARDLPDDDDTARAPVDIVVALDVSVSMNGRKLELCKETLSLLLRELSPRDRFGLVTFGDNANIAIPTRVLTKTNKESALAKIKTLHTNGCTNMSAGIGLAAQELQAVESPHEVRTIFLLTDGHANRGIANRDGIVSLTRSCLGATAVRPSISIHCFGYGVDHDSEMLGEISRATDGGSYYFVDKDSDVSSAFGDALGGVLSVVAQNVYVRIKVPSGASNLGVSILNIQHEKAIRQPDGSYDIALGDFYAEESRDIIVETSLARKSTGANVNIPHVLVSMSYLDTIKKELLTSPGVNGAVIRSADNAVSKTNDYVALQSIRINAATAVTETAALAERGNLEGARSSIRKHILKVQQESDQLEEKTNPLVVQILNELNTMFAGLSCQTEYKKSGSKYMQNKKASWQAQRSYEACDDTSSTFRSSKKQKCSMRMKIRSKGTF